MYSVYHDQGGVQSVATGDLKIILLLPKATTLQKIISFRLNPVWLNTTSIRKKSNLIGYGMTLQTNKGKCDKQNLHYLIFQSGFPLSLFILLIWHLHDDVGKGENIQTIVWSAVSQDCHYHKGRIPLPNRMNFWKKSKWPLTPSPHLRKIMLQFFYDRYGRWGSTAAWNLSESSSDLVVWPIP